MRPPWAKPTLTDEEIVEMAGEMGRASGAGEEFDCEAFYAKIRRRRFWAEFWRARIKDDPPPPPVP